MFEKFDVFACSKGTAEWFCLGGSKGWFCQKILSVYTTISLAQIAHLLFQTLAEMLS